MNLIENTPPDQIIKLQNGVSISISNYPEGGSFMWITDTGKFGVITRCSEAISEVVEGEERAFEISVILGDRDNSEIEIILVRKLAERVRCIRSDDGFFIAAVSLSNRNFETVREILDSLPEEL